MHTVGVNQRPMIYADPLPVRCRHKYLAILASTRTSVRRARRRMAILRALGCDPTLLHSTLHLRMELLLRYRTATAVRDLPWFPGISTDSAFRSTNRSRPRQVNIYWLRWFIPERQWPRSQLIFHDSHYTIIYVPRERRGRPAELITCDFS